MGTRNERLSGRRYAPAGDRERLERLSNLVVGITLSVLCIGLIIWYAVRTRVTEVDTSSHTERAAVTDDVGGAVLYQNTHVGDIDVSGLTVDEAKAKVEEYLYDIYGTTINLQVAQGRQVPVTLAQLAVYWVNPEAIDEAAHLRDGRDVVACYTLDKDLEESGLEIPLEVSLDKEAAINWLQANCSIYDVEMTGSELVTEGGVKKVKLGRVGQTLNTAEAASQLMNWGFEAVKNGDSVFILPLEELYPPSIPEGYEDYPGIYDLVMAAEAEAAEAATE